MITPTEEFDRPPKSFIGQLLCKHNWEKIVDQSWFNDLEFKNANLPSVVYRRWECKKCGKIKKQQTL